MHSRLLNALLFTLPMVAGTPFRFAVISDVHMGLDKLGNAFADLRDQSVKAVVVVGDSCDGQEGEYRQLSAFLAGTPHPKTFFTMGNHEYYAAFHKNGGEYDETGFPNGETSSACRERFNRFRGAPAAGPVYYDARVQGCRFLFLAGERSRMDDPALQDDAVLTKAQLAWLRARLGEKRKGPVFVFLHQPFQGTVSGSGAPGDGSFSVRPEGALMRILTSRPGVFFFSGHTHWRLALPTTHAERGGAHLFNTSSLRDPYDATDKPCEASMSEGLTVEVGPGKVVVKGRDFLGHRDVPGQTYVIKAP